MTKLAINDLQESCELETRDSAEVRGGFAALKYYGAERRNDDRRETPPPALHPNLIFDIGDVSL